MFDQSLTGARPRPRPAAESQPHYYEPGRYGAEGYAGVTITWVAPEDRFNLEARLGKATQLVAALYNAFGIVPPKEARTVATDKVDFIGVGVSRWHVISRSAGRRAQRAILTEAVKDLGTLVDVSHGFATFGIYGAYAARALSKLIRCDLDDAAFPPGACAATEAHGMSIQVRRMLHENSYECAVARSFGGSLFHTLVATAQSYGVQVKPCA